MIQYPETLHELHNDLLFLPARMIKVICYSHKQFKSKIKLRVNVEKSLQSD